MSTVYVNPAHVSSIPESGLQVADTGGFTLLYVVSLPNRGIHVNPQGIFAVGGCRISRGVSDDT